MKWPVSVILLFSLTKEPASTYNQISTFNTRSWISGNEV